MQLKCIEENFPSCIGLWGRVKKNSKIKMIKTIHHHAANLIAESENGKEFLVDIYDNTYPRKCYRGRVNFIGGSHDPADYSPRELLEREVKEEFSGITSSSGMEGIVADMVGERSCVIKPKKFASKEDIIKIQNSLLKFEPFKDYLIKMPAIEGKP